MRISRQVMLNTIIIIDGWCDELLNTFRILIIIY